MTVRKASALVATVAMVLSSTAWAAAPVRPSQSRSVERVGVATQALGQPIRKGASTKGASHLEGSSIVIALLAVAAVIGGIVIAADNNNSPSSR